MAQVTIIGAGNIAGAVAGIAAKAGAQVQVLARDLAKAEAVAGPLGAQAGSTGERITGDVVVLALPYAAVPEVLDRYAGALEGKVLVDVSNPVDFETFDGLVVPAGSSATAEIQARVPGATVIKAFNTNLGATLHTGTVGTVPVTVLAAGDDHDAKDAVLSLVRAAGLRGIDAGSLKRATELEAIGFLQITLAAAEKVGWTGGFAVID